MELTCKAYTLVNSLFATNVHITSNLRLLSASCAINLNQEARSPSPTGFVADTSFDLQLPSEQHFFEPQCQSKGNFHTSASSWMCSEDLQPDLHWKGFMCLVNDKLKGKYREQNSIDASKWWECSIKISLMCGSWNLPLPIYVKRCFQR